MKKSRQGLIIVNQKFDNKKAFRDGAQNDQSNLEDIYKHLNVNYEVSKNLKQFEMFDKITEFSTSIKKTCSVIFVSISTHGIVNGGLMGKEGRFINMEEIVGRFETEELMGIPKVFIIQACRGNDKERRESIGDGDHDNPTSSTQYCTLRSDVLIAYSTSKGCIAYRHKKKGSWFIEVLKKCILNTEYDDRHFVEILTICTNKIVNEYKQKNLTQTPSFCSTLRKFLKFEKGEKPPKL